MKPLEGLLVLDFSQFLAGPAAAMRLADLGARVIKIERPHGGDICRQLYISNLGVEGDSTLFHSINRNKEGFSADLKKPEDLEKVCKLFAKADVLIENFRPGVTGTGGRVEVSLLESILDLQFEVITTHLNDGGQPPNRSAVNNGHAYLGAPYGIYATDDGHLALAMGVVPRLGELLGCAPLLEYTDPKSWFTHRDEIKGHLRDHLKTQPTAHWLALLEPADICCAEIMDWARLRKTAGYQALDMEQEILCPGGTPMKTLRCPIRIDGEIYKSAKGAPAIGQQNVSLAEEFQLGSSQLSRTDLDRSRI